MTTTNPTSDLMQRSAVEQLQAPQPAKPAWRTKPEARERFRKLVDEL